RSYTRCSLTQCSALQIDERTYEPLHIQPCTGDCLSVNVDSTQVSKFIQEGKTPLVELPLVRELGSELRVTEHANSAPFLAISHVYAHRIGNKNNTMPMCQLRRLQKFLTPLHGDSAGPCLIWMDVLCVPIANEYRESRKMAVSQIAQMFRDAEGILVLDTTLLETPLQFGAVELAIRIIGSDWMRRVWTLKETMVAGAGDQSRKLIFRLKGGQARLDKLLWTLERNRSPYARSATITLKKHLTPPVTLLHRNYDLKGVEYRNTSKPGDEIFYIASLLGIDCQLILSKTNVEEKAIAFYLALNTLPLSILFCNGLRIATAPFRWAMRFFLTSNK
ncbi:hypothetical protein F5882DRAFT_236070, partial [Hyaloscypha sp. PMI_1271]